MQTGNKEQEETTVSNDPVFSSEAGTSADPSAQTEGSDQQLAAEATENRVENTPEEPAVLTEETSPEPAAVPAELELTDTAQDQELAPSATAEELSKAEQDKLREELEFLPGYWYVLHT